MGTRHRIHSSNHPKKLHRIHSSIKPSKEMGSLRSDLGGNKRDSGVSSHPPPLRRRLSPDNFGHLRALKTSHQGSVGRKGGWTVQGPPADGGEGSILLFRHLRGRKLRSTVDFWYLFTLLPSPPPETPRVKIFYESYMTFLVYYEFLQIFRSLIKSAICAEFKKGRIFGKKMRDLDKFIKTNLVGPAIQTPCIKSYSCMYIRFPNEMHRKKIVKIILL